MNTYEFPIEARGVYSYTATGDFWDAEALQDWGFIDTINAHTLIEETEGGYGRMYDNDGELLDGYLITTNEGLRLLTEDQFNKEGM